jgi:cytochrome c-type biogenesis protein CcmH
MDFWIVAAILAVNVAALLAVALLRWRPATEEGERSDLQIYRDQLASVDRDLARGTVSQEEAERLRLEIQRRLLDADRRESAEPSLATGGPPALTGAVATLAALVVIGGSLALYAAIGAPNYPDLPRADRLAEAETLRATRPSQAEMEATIPDRPEPDVSEEYRQLIEELRTELARRPGDLEGHQLLARNEANLGNFGAAHRAQARVLEIKGSESTAQDHADYGDLLVLAAGGYVSPEAEAAFEAALARDPGNGVARYYMGLMHLQVGRPDRAFQLWERLLRESGPSAPWVGPIRGQIEGAAARAGIDYSLPPLQSAPAGAAPGPTAADIEAAEGMSPEARMAMIEGMVSGLSDRLATEGGPPEDWARLIRALGVLGRRGQAAAIWEEAQNVFPDEATRLPILRAARDAGVAQ